MHPINQYIADHIETIVYTFVAVGIGPVFGYMLFMAVTTAVRDIRMSRRKRLLEMWQSANESHPGLYTREVAIQQGKINGSILCVSNLSPRVGYAWWLMHRFWQRLAKEMQCHLVFALQSDVPENVANIAPVHFADMSTLKSLRLIRQLNVKHIYLTDWPGFHPIYFLWRLLGVRSIIVHDHVPGDPEPAPVFRGSLKKILHALRMFSATRCIAVAEHVRERHTRTWCMPGEKCKTVTNGIDPFPVDPEKRDEVRKRLGIPQNAKVLVMVCRAMASKGLGFAIECLESAKHKGQEFHLAHFGDGPDLEHFKQLANSKGVGDRMHFLGHHPNVREYLSAFDAAIHPSKGEAMSLAILECMCAGLPVVVPNIRSVQAAIREGVTGRSYAPDHIPSALYAIETVTPAMGQQAREAVLSHYNFARTMAEFEQHVVSMITPEPLPAQDRASSKPVNVGSRPETGKRLPRPDPCPVRHEHAEPLRRDLRQSAES